MKLKKGLSVKKIIGEYLLLSDEESNGAFTGTFVLNDVSAFICKKLKKEITYDELIDSIIEVYNVEKNKATKDVDIILNIFRKHDILEE